jgi:biotin operon repressor
MYYSNEIANGVNHFMADTNTRAVIGDNSSAAELDDASGGPSFAEIVKDVLSSGLLIVQNDAMKRAIRDPRLSHRSRVVLTFVMDHTNSATGMAFPGRKLLAERSGYTEAGVAKALQELRELGYIVDCKRAGPNGGRALMHYVVVKTTPEQREAAITAHVMAIRKLGTKADVTPVGKLRPDVPNGGYISSNVPNGGYDRQICSQADVPSPLAKIGADVPYGGSTVTRREEETRSEVSIGDAIASPGAAAPSPADEDTTSSFAGSAWIDPDALNGEILDLDPVDDDQRFEAKSKAKHKASAKPKATKVPFPENWTEPGKSGLTIASKFGLGQERAEDEFQLFRDHYIGKGDEADKWIFLWQAWCRRAGKRPAYGNRASNGWVDAMRATRAAPVVPDDELL